MIRMIRLSSVGKEFFELLERAKRQKKYISITKLVVVSTICFLVIGLYAWWVNQASTRGYFLKQETRTYDALLFQRSIVHLDTLKLERNLYNEVLNKRNAWYALEDRRTVLEIGKPVFADIGTGEEIRMDVGSMDVTSTIIE